MNNLESENSLPVIAKKPVPQKAVVFWLRMAALAVLALMAFLIFTYVYYINDLASPENLMNRNNTGLIIYDRNGKQLYKSSGIKQFEPVSFDKIPQYLKDATVAVEDKNFYRHPAFSIPSIARSTVADLLSGSASFGGSTITQQLVKNSVLSSEKTFKRKAEELVLAVEVERRYSKDKILEMYLNSIYYGNGAYGVQEASQTYFGKSVDKITLNESAVLASLPYAPSLLSPFGGDREKLLNRRNLILSDMEKQGYIKTAEKNQAESEEIKFIEPPKVDSQINAPHFSLFVRDLVYQMYGEDNVIRQGFRVKTTLDSSLQEAAQNILSRQVTRLSGDNVSNGGLVTINPNSGEILAMVGSTDWNNDKFGKFNVVFAKRQPGSSFKPVVYTQAFTDGYKTTDILHDVPTDFNGYKPKDYDGRFRGNVTLRRALANSLNIPSVELLQKIGVDKAISLANAMGITTITDPQKYGLSLVLGGGEVELFELTRAYGVLADGGKLVPSHFILSVDDKYNKNIYLYDPISRQESSQSQSITIGNLLNPPDVSLDREHIGGSGDKRAADEDAAFITTHILKDDRARSEIFGSGSALLLSRPAAAKTGTTDDYRDAWTIGYTPDLVTGVWIGNNDNTPMDRIAGSLGAAPIWHDVMETAERNIPVHNFVMPSDIVEVKVCADNFALACNSCSQPYTEVYKESEAPKNICPENLTPTQSPSPVPQNTVSPSDTVPPPTLIENSPTVEQITVSPSPLPTLTAVTPSIPTPSVQTSTPGLSPFPSVSG